MISRYFVKFTVRGVPGIFWTDLRVWDVDKKSMVEIMAICLAQATKDAKKKISKKVAADNVDIDSFSLIESVTKVTL
jgi:hypothetical protein